MTAMDIAIIQTIKVGREKRHILRGYVRDVPARTTMAEIRDRLTDTGHAPTEAGIAWANHQVIRTGILPNDLQDPGNVPELSWAGLGTPKRSQLNVRLSPRLLAACRQRAQEQGQKLNDWVEAALTAATRQD